MHNLNFVKCKILGNYKKKILIEIESKSIKSNKVGFGDLKDPQNLPVWYKMSLNFLAC